jgi:hypothetical protein
MANNPMPEKEPASVLRVFGSLWFAGVILLLLMVAMGTATVFEHWNGTEQTSKVFYASRWFTFLLGLFGLNILCALLARYPFKKKQLGFVVAHVSILVVLIGALVTKKLAIDGQVALEDGQTGSRFYLPHREALTITNHGEASQQASLELPASALEKLEKPHKSGVLARQLGKLQVEIEQYLPDSREEQKVLNDNPQPNPAVEVLLAAGGKSNQEWVFANATESPSSGMVSFRLVSNDELRQLTSKPAASQPVSKGTMKIEYQGSTFEISVEDALTRAVPLGDTGCTVRVLRHLPHARVGEDSTVTNLSDRPVNPALDVEVSGPAGSEKRFAFARFPEFQSMHSQKQGIEGLSLIYQTEVEATGLEVLGSDDGQMYLRYHSPEGDVESKQLTLGQPAQTSLSGLEFSVLRRFDNARIERTLLPVQPIRTEREPAILVKLVNSDQSRSLWLKKNDMQHETIDGSTYGLSYESAQLPLGFDLTLNKFTIGHYPGARRPRSFESQITITDQTTGRVLNQVISMNHPVSYGAYTLYQSSYQRGGERLVSILSVSWDPGKPVVFAGYIGLMIGMLLVLIRKISPNKTQRNQK